MDPLKTALAKAEDFLNNPNTIKMSKLKIGLLFIKSQTNL